MNQEHAIFPQAQRHVDTLEDVAHNRDIIEAGAGTEGYGAALLRSETRDGANSFLSVGGGSRHLQVLELQARAVDLLRERDEARAKRDAAERARAAVEAREAAMEADVSAAAAALAELLDAAARAEALRVTAVALRARRRALAAAFLGWFDSTQPLLATAQANSRPSLACWRCPPVDCASIPCYISRTSCKTRSFQPWCSD